MAEGGGTIIIGTLDDSALRKSIDDLTKTIASKTNEMATSFDSAISKMAESLGKLGNTSTQVNSQSTQRAETMKKEAAATQETTVKYDQLAQAQQKVTQNTSLETNLKSLRENAANLQITLKSVENLTLDKQFAEYQRFEVQIESTRKKIEDLKEQLRSGDIGGSRLVQGQKMQEIAQLEQQVQMLTAKQIEAVRKIEQEDKQWAAMLRQEYDSIMHKIQEMLGTKQADAKFSQKQLSDAQKYSIEIQNQVQYLKEVRAATDKIAQKSAETALKTEFQRTMKMPTESVDQMQEKLEKLKVLLQSLQEVGLLSPAQIVSTEQTIEKLNSELAKTSPIVQQNSQAVNNQAKDFSHLLNQSKEMEVQQRNTWLGWVRGGLQAQESLRRIRTEMQSLSAKKGGALDADEIRNVVGGYQNLIRLFNQLNSAYYALSDAQKNSAKGMAMKEDLELVRRLIPQMKLLGFGAMSVKEKLTEMESELAKLNREYMNLWKTNTGTQEELLKMEALKSKIEGLKQSIKDLKSEEESKAQVSKKVAQANLEIEQSNIKLISSNDRLARTFDYIQRRVAFLVTTYGSMNLVKKIIDVRAEFETMERSLGVLMDSARRGSEMFNELNQMALNSPFTTMELGSAARQLLAYGVAEEELVDTTRRLADISAAVGTPIERISYALGQVQTYGYLTSLQAKSFMRAGIPLVKELAAMYTELEGRMVSTGEVYERMKDKAVSYDDVLKVIKKDTDAGGRFFDYQAKMATTLKVQLANLDLAWQNMLNSIGKSNQGLITAPIKLMRSMMQNWRELSDLIKSAAIAYGVYKMAMMVVMQYQRGKAILDTREILNSRTATYQTNERRLALGKLTVAERENVLAQRSSLIAVYKARIANGELTASEIRKKLAVDKSNIALVTAAYDAGLVTKAEYKMMIQSNATAGAFARMGTFLKGSWVFVLLTAVVELTMRIANMGEVAENVTRTVVDNVKESAKELNNFLEQNNEIRKSFFEKSGKTETVTEKTNSRGGNATSERPIYQNVSDSEAAKAWESIRDEIEKSSAASDVFISKLLQIDNVNDRVRAGFEYVEKLKNIHDTLQMIHKENIEINEDWSKPYTLEVFGQDGLKENLEEYVEDLDTAFKFNKSLAEQSKFVGEQMSALAEANSNAIDTLSWDFEKDLKDTMDSLRKENFRLKLVDPEAQRESLEQFLASYIQEEGIAADQAAILRINAEKEYASAAIAEYDGRLAYAKKTNDTEAEDRIQKEKASWLESFGYGRASFQMFFSELRKAHSDLFSDMSMEELQLLDKNSKEYKTMIHFLENEFKNSQIAAHKVAYNDLRGRVDDIKSWIINIPIFFSIKTDTQALKEQIRGYVGKEGGAIEVGDAKSTYEYAQKINKEYDDVVAERKYLQSLSKRDAKDEEKLKKLLERENELLVQRSQLNVGQSKQEIKTAKEAAKEAARRAAEEKRRQKQAELAAKKGRRQAELATKRAEAKRKHEEAARKREQHRQESELAKALRDEISLIEKLRSEYEKLKKAGIRSETITDTLKEIANPSIERINKVLKSYKVPVENAINLSDFFDSKKGVIKYQELYNYFDNQIKTLKATGRAIDDDYKVLVEEMVKLLTDSLVEISDDIDKELEKGLAKTLEGYELSLDVAQDPELMSSIASALGLDLEQLLTDANAPRTLDKYIEQVNWWLNQAIQKHLDLKNLGSLEMIKGGTDKKTYAEYTLSDTPISNARRYNILVEDDIKALRTLLGAQSDVVKIAEEQRKKALELMRKDFSNTVSEWSKLIEKYGDFQTKLLKISKDTASEEYNVIKKYASNDDDKLQAWNLATQIKIADNPQDVARLQGELTTLMNKVVGGNQKGKDIISAILNKQKELISKAEWENFKDSPLYSKTFEDLERVGTITLETLMDELDKLKDKVKDSPESMKALMDAFKKIREELEGRAPFEGMINSAKELYEASERVREAKKNYKDAKKNLEDLQKLASRQPDKNNDAFVEAYVKAAREQGMSEEEIQEALQATQEGFNGATVSAEDLAAAEEFLAFMTKMYADAQNNLRDKMKSFITNTKNASNTLNKIGGVIDNVKDLFGFVDDSDAGVALNAMASGFKGVASALALVVTIAELAETSLGWVAVVGMALAALIASLNFIANYNDNKISKKVARSEREVKKLQNTLKELEQTADDAYGAITIGAQNAIRANKELQLVELERQLVLEQSRKKKKRDEDKIIDLKGQIIDLRNEINNTGKDVVNDMLGISGGSWAEDLVKSMIDAFRQGENAMEQFGEKWDEMIDNMIMKYIVSTVMQKWWDNVLEGVQNIEEAYTADIAKEKADAQRLYDDIQGTSLKEVKKQMIQEGYTNALLDKFGTSKWYTPQMITDEEAKNWLNVQLQAQQQVIDTIDERLNQASIDATKASMDYMIGRRGEGEAIADQLKDVISQYYTFGDKGDKSLSQLQQGIQGITEDTAGALEAYMNGVSQQVYLQSDLMIQIRDALVGFDPTLQLGIQSQMLLELQNSYQIQVAIQNILVGWSNPSGNAVQVSLI